MKLLVTKFARSEDYGNNLVVCGQFNPGETITAGKHCEQIDEMHQKLFKKRPPLVNTKGLILLHDNAGSHVPQVTLNKLNNLHYETLLPPSLSPDLSPIDYHFFRHLDNFLQQKIFKIRGSLERVFNLQNPGTHNQICFSTLTLLFTTICCYWVHVDFSKQKNAPFFDMMQ